MSRLVDGLALDAAFGQGRGIMDEVDQIRSLSVLRSADVLL